MELEAEGEEEVDAELEQDPAGEADGSGSGEGDSGPAGLNLPPSISARTRERSRDREGGAETEVEADGNGGIGARLGMQRSRTRVNQGSSQMNPAIDLMEASQLEEDEDGLRDTEMMDAAHDPMDPSHRRRVSLEDVDAVRSTSLSPDLNGAGQTFGLARAGTSAVAVGADTSEGEGSAGSAEGVAMDADLGGSGGEGDLAIGAKRKR